MADAEADEMGIAAANESWLWVYLKRQKYICAVYGQAFHTTDCKPRLQSSVATDFFSSLPSSVPSSIALAWPMSTGTTALKTTGLLRANHPLSIDVQFGNMVPNSGNLSPLLVVVVSLAKSAEAVGDPRTAKWHCRMAGCGWQ